MIRFWVIAKHLSLQVSSVLSIYRTHGKGKFYFAEI